MSHISGFQKFKLMLENNNINYMGSTVINEAGKLKDLEPIQAGNDIPSLGITKGTALGNAYNIALEYIKANMQDTEITEMLKSWRLILKEDSDLLSVSFVGADVRGWKSINWAALSYATKAAREANSGRNPGKKFMDSLKYQDMVRTLEYNIDLVPNTDSSLSTDVYTVGKVVKTTGQKISDKGEQTSSLFEATKQYINAFNFYNYAAGGDTYEGDAELVEDGYFNFESENINGTSLTVYTSKLSSKGAVKKEIETETKVVGYEPALRGQADIKFEQGKSAIPSGEMTKVDALAKVILEKFKGKKVDKFELISSASPEWAGKETMADYAGKKTNGVGDPGAGTDFATNNFKLAYDRGVSLMTALNKKLKAAGHTGFPSYVVKWQVSDKGGPANNGRYVDLELDSNENKGKEVTTTKVVGKVEKEKGMETGKYVLYAYTME